MTDKSFETHSVALSVLTPIHIGCGEVYEPTNFVADSKRNLLYGFDPSLVKLTASMSKKLLRAANSNSISEIYQFYLENLDRYKVFSKVIVPFDERIGKNIQKLVSTTEDFNRNQIERTCYCEKGELQVPYIPGSAIKGAIHTALLDRLVAEHPDIKPKKGDDIDKEVLGGGMNHSPMKLISISDFHAVDSDGVKQKVILASRVHKKDVLVGDPSEISSAFEVLQRAQFRPFTGTLTLRKKHPKDKVRNDYQNFRQIFKDLNRYSLKEFESEYGFWERSGRVGRPWMVEVKKLLDGLQPQLREGIVALVRIGKNCGAQNLTLRQEGVAQIKIRGRKGEKPRLSGEATTMFVTMEEGHGYPFGWAILEFTEFCDGRVLKSWCENRNKGIKPIDFKTLRKKFLEEKAGYVKEFEEDQRRLAGEREKAKQKQAEEQKREEELKGLSVNKQTVVKLYEEVEKVNTVRPGDGIYQRFVALLEEAKQWSAEEQRFLAKQFLGVFKKKGLDAGKKGKEIKSKLKAYSEV